MTTKLKKNHNLTDSERDRLVGYLTEGIEDIEKAIRRSKKLLGRTSLADLKDIQKKTNHKWYSLPRLKLARLWAQGKVPEWTWTYGMNATAVEILEKAEDALLKKVADENRQYPVATEKGKVRKRLWEMTAGEISQVLDPAEGIRSLKEQRRYVSSRRAERARAKGEVGGNYECDSVVRDGKDASYLWVRARGGDIAIRVHVSAVRSALGGVETEVA